MNFKTKTIQQDSLVATWVIGLAALACLFSFLLAPVTTSAQTTSDTSSETTDPPPEEAADPTLPQKDQPEYPRESDPWASYTPPPQQTEQASAPAPAPAPQPAPPSTSTYRVQAASPAQPPAAQVLAKESSVSATTTPNSNTLLEDAAKESSAGSNFSGVISKLVLGGFVFIMLAVVIFIRLTNRR